MLGRVSVGQTCKVLSPLGDVLLEQLDAAGEDWFGAGPGGESLGTITEAFRASAHPDVDPEWLVAVLAALERELVSDHRRSFLSLRAATGTWYHATRSESRDSIRRYGLDWARMSAPGIAGSVRPESAGIFLCATLESAQWFARMFHTDGADVWSARLEGGWLESSPGDGGGLGEDWMIYPQPIPASQIRLIEQNIRPGR
jgi:hypothetical protein